MNAYSPETLAERWPEFGGAPVSMREAARLLGVSYDTLRAFIKEHPHYHTMGRAKLFYREDLEALKEAQKCRSESKSAATAPTGTSSGLSPERVCAKALALATGKPHNSFAKHAKSGSCNVVSMERKQPRYSQRRP